ncbi:MAG: hypothetical protein N2C14_32840, partial [Planctomycetales bacterium]
AQELLSNLKKHSRSRKATLTLRLSGAGVQLTIQDWGVGFDSSAIPEIHHGLQGIHERARVFGGNVGIESRVGDGCKITVELPIQ